MRNPTPLLLGLLTGLALLTPLAVDAQTETQPRFAFINSQAIMEATPAVREAQQVLQQEVQQYEAQVQQMSTQLDSMIQAYQQQQLTLSAGAKAERQAAIQTRQTEFQEKVQQLERQAAQRERDLVQPVMDRINQVIETIRAERQYALVFDVAAGAIIAADPALDITEEVIQRLGATAGDTTGAPGSGN